MQKILFYFFIIYLLIKIKSETNYYYFTFKNIDSNHCQDLQKDFTFVINFKPHNLTSVPSDCVNKTNGLISFSEVNGTNPKTITPYCKLTYSNNENHIRCSNFEFNESYRGLYKLNDLKENINFKCNNQDGIEYNITFYNFSYDYYFSDTFEFNDPNSPTFENGGYVFYIFDNILTLTYPNVLNENKIPRLFVGDDEIFCEIAKNVNLYTLYCYIDPEKYPVKEGEEESTYLITYLDICDVYETDKNYTFIVSNKGNSKSNFFKINYFFLLIFVNIIFS